MNIISERKKIREMEASELVEYVSDLADLDDTTGTVQRLVKIANEEYKSITGRDMRADIDKLPISCGAMLLAAYDPALCTETTGTL